MKIIIAICILLASIQSQALDLKEHEAFDLYNFIAKIGQTPSGILNHSCMPGLCSTSITNIYCAHSLGMEEDSENYHCLFELFWKRSFKALEGENAQNLFERILGLKDLSSDRISIMKLSSIRCHTTSKKDVMAYKCSIEE